MMKQRISIFLLFTLLLFANGYAQKGIMRLTQQTLMHEVRETPSPLAIPAAWWRQEMRRTFLSCRKLTSRGK